ncbi:MAG: hypothetical protein H7Z42_07885, partial [Roseiflexaceae bacterium]|nr:hypothetical protein [Roseiflexaceae bacterium]
SIPLIAIMLVVLFGLVGLSVDVGNTYAEQRNVVRATNAAALAGIDAVIRGSDDRTVSKIVNESLMANGMMLQGASTSTGEDSNGVTGNRTVRAYYMNVEGKHLCDVGSCDPVPASTNYIQVTVGGTVDTYFARVVGRPNLPVANTSFAYRCPPTNGVYPIAVSFENIDFSANQFKLPTANDQKGPNGEQDHGTYSDTLYDSKVWRRIYLKDTGFPAGSFSWLRWTNEKQSGAELATALGGEGTLVEGFEEAAWPTGFAESAPTGYPLSPKQLTPGDWIHGDPGLSWSNGGNGSVRPALEAHLTKRTMMILPIIDAVAGQGANSQFKMAAFGKFYIVDGHPNDPNKGGISQNGGRNAYIDLVYLGPANESPCLVTNIDPIDDTSIPPGTETPEIPTPSVRIPIRVNPRWSEPTNPADPIAYQLVVDMSGSMSWNFSGEGTLGGTVGPLKDTTGGTNWRCEYANKSNNYEYKDSCQGGPNSSWWKYTERRVYVTKQAIRSLVEDLNPEDMMRYTAFSTRGDDGFSSNTKVVPSSGFTSDKALLLSQIDSLGWINNDPYRTSGGTPGPQALSKARSIISQTPATSPSGRKYRKVVIYITDGVANVFLNGTSNQARDNCGDRSVTAALNSPDCQIGLTATNQMRPITAMIDQANKIKEADKEVEIYVLAMAGVATDGLGWVASDQSMLYTADKPGFVAAALNAIRSRVTKEDCVPRGGAKFIDRIMPANYPTGMGLASDEFGKATIYNDTGTVTIGVYPIKHGQPGGALEVDADLPPGNYQIELWVGYKGPDKPTMKNYVYDSLSWEGVRYANRLSFSVGANASLNDTRVLPPIFVDLKNTAVCPAK